MFSKRLSHNFRLVIFLLLSLSLSLFINIGNAQASNNSHQFLADIDGDGKDDAIVFFPSNGEWWASISNGTQFSTPARWISGHGVGSSRQFVADVTCDGKDDAVVFFPDGRWYVAPSNGTSFTNGDPGFYPYLWLSGAGVGSIDQMISSQHGNSCSDAFVTFSDGSWWEYDSPGSERWSQAIAGEAVDLQTPPNMRYSSGHGVGATNRFVNDVNGDGKADLVTFFSQDGSWYVSQYLGNGEYSFPNLAIRGHGVGSEKQFLVDIDKGVIGTTNAADAIVYFGNSKWSGAPASVGWKYNTSTGYWTNTGQQSDFTFFIPNVYPSGDDRMGSGSSSQIIGNPTGGDFTYGTRNKPGSTMLFYNDSGSWYDGFSTRWIMGLGAGSQ